jgi:hypothetical protein
VRESLTDRSRCGPRPRYFRPCLSSRYNAQALTIAHG